MRIPPGRLRDVSVKTQVSTAGGRLDIEIASPDTLLYVEVKVDWDVEADELSKQLAKYRRVLESRGRDRHRILSLLTRLPAPELPQSASPDSATRWLCVAETLNDGATRHLHNDEIGKFLVEQFTSFLASRNIAMNHVGEGIPDGLRAMRSLLLMLGEALRACDVEPKTSFAWDYVGYNCEHHGVGKCYWVGFEYEWPSHLWFCKERIRLKRKHLAGLDVGGEVEDDPDARGCLSWSNGFDVSPANTAFFQASAAEQLDQVRCFLKDSVEKARRIEAEQESRSR